MARPSKIQICYKPTSSMCELLGISVVDKLYRGGNGTIYKGVDSQTQQDVAVKYSKSDLSNEYKIMKKLSNVVGIPKVYSFGEQGKSFYMSMEYLNQDLCDISGKVKQFSLKSTCLIAIKILEILKGVHQANIVHRDIKPSNLMIKSNEDEQIYLIDFGIAKFVDQFSPPGEIEGTIIYDPIQTHKKQQYRFIDDIEMLSYTLTSLYNGINICYPGNLPWIKFATKVVATDEVMCMKEKFLSSKKMTSLPFSELFGYIKWNQNSNIPNHDFLISLFRKILQNNKLEENYIYDWSYRSNATPLSSTKTKTSFSFFQDHLHTSDSYTDLQEEETVEGASSLNSQFYKFFSE